jgi:hypothetical protein
MKKCLVVFLCSASALYAQVSTPDRVALQVLEKVLAPALKAYQAGDARALYGLFAKAAPGVGDVKTVERVFLNYYREKFGALKAVRLSPAESAVDLDRGMLVYDALFEKAQAKLSANFLREDGEIRLMQLRIEEIELE